MRERIIDLRFREALEGVWELVTALNRTIDERKPWTLQARPANRRARRAALRSLRRTALAGDAAASVHAGADERDVAPARQRRDESTKTGRRRCTPGAVSRRSRRRRRRHRSSRGSTLDRHALPRPRQEVRRRPRRRNRARASGRHHRDDYRRRRSRRQPARRRNRAERTICASPPACIRTKRATLRAASPPSCSRF